MTETIRPKIPLRVVIITHLGDAFLLKCIRSIEDSTVSAEIIVLVSNQRKLPLPDGIQSHQFLENVGYARAVNFAFQHYGSQPLLILNDDIVLHKDCLETLWAAYDEAQVLQPEIRFYADPDHIENTGHRLRLDGSNEAYSRGELQDQSPVRSRLCFSGAAFLIPPQIMEAVGYFDPDLSPFGEDLDYSMRVIRQGFQIRVVPNTIAYHKLGHSFGRFSRRKTMQVESHRIQARFRSYPLCLLPLAPISTLHRYWQAKDHPLVPIDKRQEAVMGSILGIIKGYAALPKALQKRRSDTRKLSDWKFIGLLLKQP